MVTPKITTMINQREPEGQESRPLSLPYAKNPNAIQLDDTLNAEGQRPVRGDQQVRFDDLPKLDDNSVVINVQDGIVAADLGPPAPPRELPFKGFMYLCLG